MAKRKRKPSIADVLAGIGQDVSGGAKQGAKRTVKRRSTGPVVLPSADPYTQLKEVGALDRKGRQKKAGPKYGPGRRGPQRIVRTKRGKTAVVPKKDAKELLAILNAFEETKRAVPKIKAPKGLLEDILEETPTARALGLTKKVVRSADVDLGDATRFAVTQRAKPKPGGKKREGTVGAVVAGRAGPRTFAGAVPVKAAIETGRATAEDPIGVSKNTALGLKDTVIGLPAAAVKSVKDPKGAVEEYIADIKRRYGPLMAGDERKFRERIKKEGAAPELLEFGALAGGAGAVVGRATAIAGHVPKPRPKLRSSGGVSREQPVAVNATTRGAQRVHDKARRRQMRRRTEKAQRRDGGRVSALDEAATHEGAVVPLRPKKRQEKQVAGKKSRAVQSTKLEQAHEIHKGARQTLAKLNKAERRGFKWAMQLGIRDAAGARRHLKDRREDIVAERKERGTVIPEVLRKQTDNLRDIDYLIENADAVFTPRLAKAVELERARSNRLGAADPGLAAGQRLLRRYEPVAVHLKLSRKEGETTPVYVKRIRETAEKEGLGRPAYYPSQKRPTMRFSDWAVGGTKAEAMDKTWTGALFRTGREDTRPEAYTQGLAKNIKRKHNWKLVADNFDAHSFDWGRNKTFGQLLDEMDTRKIDPTTVAFWNPRKYREERAKFERDGSDESTGLGDEPVAAGVGEAVRASTAKLVKADDGSLRLDKGSEFVNTGGWTAIPKAVHDEIHSDTRPSGKGVRSWDVVMGKQSRVLLGTNPPWLAFQTASNVLLTGLAKTGPVDAIKAQIWWKRLTPEERAAVEPYVGLGPHQVDVAQTKLGSTANGQIVNAWRALKQTPIATRASRLNPLDALFRADNAQNNFFRRSVLYSQVKRDAYARMGKNVSLAQKTQDRTVGLLSLGPEKQMKGLIREMETLERHAQYVNEMLGDYVTYTAKERRLFKRSVMFYGFMRFSLHFTFYTMPIKHPVMTALIGNLSRMQAEEVKELLGGDELPFALGRIYYTKKGKLMQSDLSRMNPAGNIITQAVGDPRPLAKLGAILPPVVSTLLDIAYEKTLFKGKTMRVKGESGFSATAREAAAEGLGGVDIARIAGSRLARLAYPYRIWEEMEYKGVPQGDDALPWSPRPTEYKDAEILGHIRQSKKRFQKKGTGQNLLEQILPFLPQESRDVELAESIRERREARRGDAPAKSPYAEWKEGQASGLSDYREWKSKQKSALDDYKEWKAGN